MYIRVYILSINYNPLQFVASKYFNVFVADFDENTFKINFIHIN